MASSRCRSRVPVGCCHAGCSLWAQEEEGPTSRNAYFFCRSFQIEREKKMALERGKKLIYIWPVIRCQETLLARYPTKKVSSQGCFFFFLLKNMSYWVGWGNNMMIYEEKTRK